MEITGQIVAYHWPRLRTRLLISRSGRSKGYAQANRRRVGKEIQSATLGVMAIRMKELILSGHRRCSLRMKRLSAPGLRWELKSLSFTFTASFPDSGSLSMNLSISDGAETPITSR